MTTLTKEVAVDKIEVLGNGSVQVRTATRVLEYGTVISRSFSRHVLQCSTKSGEVRDADGVITTEGTWGDTDISGESTEVQAICNAVWTDAVKTAYQTAMDAQEI